MSCLDEVFNSELFNSSKGLLEKLDKLVDEGQRAQQRWVYRGQSRAKWELKPTIERRTPKAIRQSESALLWDFTRLASSLSDRLPGFNDIPSWLALMRHHGVPTRLLDWTDSSYISLFFACEEGERKQEDDDQNCAIWALNLSLVQQRFQERASAIVEPKTWNLSKKKHFEDLAFYTFDDLTGPRSEHGLVGELSPRKANSRMAFQQGTFLINCNHQLGFEESLKRMMEGQPTQSPWGWKLTFPWTLSVELRRHLYDKNVHPFTLFPDLDGLGRLLKVKSEIFRSA